MAREQWKSGDLTFDVLIDGPAAGEPILLLHGFPQNSSVWDAVNPTLHAAGYRTLAPDQRGYSPGARPADPRAYRIDELVADVVALLDAREIEAVNVVGHDLGAVVAWQFAGRHPERSRTLTAISVPHPMAMLTAIRSDPDQRRKSAYIPFFRRRWLPERVLLAFNARVLRSVFRGSGLSRAETDRYVRPLRERGALTAALNWYRALSSRDAATLGPITCPTTYVWSDQDVALGRTCAEDCGAHVAGDYRFVELRAISHWVPDQVPDRLAEILLARVSG